MKHQNTQNFQPSDIVTKKSGKPFKGGGKFAVISQVDVEKFGTGVICIANGYEHFLRYNQLELVTRGNGLEEEDTHLGFLHKAISLKGLEQGERIAFVAFFELESAGVNEFMNYAVDDLVEDGILGDISYEYIHLVKGTTSVIVGVYAEVDLW